MREIWRGGLALARNDFGSCLALAGADNFAQKIKNHAICCESLTWRGFDFELFRGCFRAVFSQNRLFFKEDLTLNFSFMRHALQKKYARFNTIAHAKFATLRAIFLQISSAKFAFFLAIFKFIFARFASGTFIFTLKICFANLIKFALLSLAIKTIKICNKCALKPIFAPLRTKFCLNLRRNFATILHLKLIANLQLLRQISHSIFAINSRFNLHKSKNLVLNSPADLNLHKNFHLNLRPNLFENLRSNSHIYLNLCRNLLMNSHLSRKNYFNFHQNLHLNSRTIFKVKLSRNLFAILFLLRQNLSLNSLLNRHSCAILPQINLQSNMSLSRCGLSSLLILCAILRPNLLLNLLEILRSLHQILPPKLALYQNLILRKSFCCDLHLSSSENSRANSRLIERISCEKVA